MAVIAESTDWIIADVCGCSGRGHVIATRASARSVCRHISGEGSALAERLHHRITAWTGDGFAGDGGDGILFGSIAARSKVQSFACAERQASLAGVVWR